MTFTQRLPHWHFYKAGISRCSHTGRSQTEQYPCFVVPVPGRSAATLLAVIIEKVEEGSTICSDCWAGYNSQALREAGFEHTRVNHRYNFVDEATGAQAQNIERLGSSAKWRNQRHGGTARHHLESYLAEFMWRKILPSGTCSFEAISGSISAFMPSKQQ